MARKVTVVSSCICNLDCLALLWSLSKLPFLPFTACSEVTVAHRWLRQIRLMCGWLTALARARDLVIAVG